MKMIFNEPRARYLPSRYQFAIVRLLAMIRFHLPQAVRTEEPFAYAASGAHCAWESYGTSLWFFLTTLVYFATLVNAFAAVLLAIAAMQIPLYLGMPVTSFLSNRARGNAIFYMVLMTAASVYFVRTDSPARYAAWVVFALLGLNAIAAVLMLAFRARAREMERTCGI